MEKSESAFHWGIGAAMAIIVLSTSLQVFNRAQDRSRRRTRSEIVRTQQTFAESQARFSSLVRPEVLRGIVIEIYPKMQSIGFNKTISAAEIKLIEAPES